MNIIEIGALIRDQRKKARLSQQELAGQLGMNRSTISLLETGNVFEIGLQKVLRICMVLKLEVVVRPYQAPAWDDANRRREEEVAQALRSASNIVKGNRP
jgi:transcriptional regulator with XRE-family HTH domain